MTGLPAVEGNSAEYWRNEYETAQDVINELRALLQEEVTGWYGYAVVRNGHAEAITVARVRVDITRAEAQPIIEDLSALLPSVLGVSL